MRYSVPIGRCDFFDAVQARFDAGASRMGVGASTSDARISTAHTVGAGETTTHEQFCVEREGPQVSGPTLARRLRFLLRDHSIALPSPSPDAKEQQKQCYESRNNNGYSDGGLQPWVTGKAAT